MPSPSFPFGAPSTARPPRRPAGATSVFVLGVYPSALHVRWTPPAWAVDSLDAKPIGSLAVADEPIVFWDGETPDAASCVEEWKSSVEFRDGDEPGSWGAVQGAGNGTSGRPVRDRVLEPLGVSTDQTWFTDAVNTYFVKQGAGSQGKAMEERYSPVAEALGLSRVQLPARPSIADLIATATKDHRQRLRAELQDSATPLVVTLGEEARQVMAEIVDESSGPPCRPLTTSDPALASSYGKPGAVRAGNLRAEWLALVHPGQRSKAWANLHDAWAADLLQVRRPQQS